MKVIPWVLVGLILGVVAVGTQDFAYAAKPTTKDKIWNFSFVDINIKKGPLYDEPHIEFFIPIKYLGEEPTGTAVLHYEINGENQESSLANNKVF